MASGAEGDQIGPVQLFIFPTRKVIRVDVMHFQFVLLGFTTCKTEWIFYQKRFSDRMPSG
jgi:hypothetical protein